MTQKRDEYGRKSAWHVAGLPAAQGLYDPRNEHDACGIGFIANIHNRKSHKMIQDGLKILENLEHRGAVGADPKAGDGAGILIQMPDGFFRKEATKLGIELRAEGHYGVGMLFMPKAEAARAKIVELVNKIVAEEGQTLLGWRDVPVDNTDLGESVKPTEPHHMQVFVARSADCADQDVFERKLFVIRKRVFNTLLAEE
ncbi:MAG: glutamate synthase subunit alpha, partial [Parvibaculum sp.]